MVETMDFQDAHHGSAPYCVSAGIFTHIRGDLLCITTVVCRSNSGFQDLCGWVEDSEGCRGCVFGRASCEKCLSGRLAVSDQWIPIPEFSLV
jgi:hypothetical protein